MDRLRRLKVSPPEEKGEELAQYKATWDCAIATWFSPEATNESPDQCMGAS